MNIGTKSCQLNYNEDLLKLQLFSLQNNLDIMIFYFFINAVSLFGEKASMAILKINCSLEWLFLKTDLLCFQQLRKHLDTLQFIFQT